MKKNGWLILFLWMCHLTLLAEDNTVSVVKLNNGDTFVGEVIWQNETIIMLQTKENKRFQFRRSDIERIERKTVQTTHTQLSTEQEEKKRKSTFVISAVGGYATSIQADIAAPKAGVHLTVGRKELFGKQTLLGIGAGYENLFDPNKGSIAYMPLFLMTQYRFKKTATTPIASTKIGYLLSLQDNYRGATMCQIMGGIYHSYTDKLALQTGLTINIAQINGQITEKNRLGTYISNGNSILYSFGIEFAIHF